MTKVGQLFEEETQARENTFGRTEIRESSEKQYEYTDIWNKEM